MENPEIILTDLTATDAWIKALARHLVSAEDDAEDVAQDAWVRALASPPRRAAAFKTWMREVARNLAVSVHRSSTRRGERERKAARPDRLPSVDEMLEREETRIKVARAVASLEEPYRSTILYRYFEGLPPREIATRLGVSVSAVNERLRRGLEKLRARLDRDFGDRMSWCAALLPLAGSGLAAGGAASASVLTGALVMSTKVKIAIAVIVALGVAWAFWPQGERVAPPEVPGAESSEPVPPLKKIEAKAEPAPVQEAEATAAVAEPEPLARPSAISLEPARGSIVGLVTDPNGAPIPGAAVRALSFVPGAVELEHLLETKTDSAGRYVLKPIQTRCAVEARAEGHYAERRLASPFTREDFRLGQPGILRGTIRVAATGTPCAGATVAIYRFRVLDHLEHSYYPILRWTWLRPPIATTRSDRSGHYRFADLRPGSYQVRILPSKRPSGHTGREAVEIVSGKATTCDMPVGRGATSAGRVTDSESQAPIVGARVCVKGNYRRVALTGPDGRYEREGVEPRAMHLFRVVARGYIFAFAQIPVAMSHGSMEVRDFTLRPGVLVSGRVLGPDGEPVAGARVSRGSSVFCVPTEDPIISYICAPASRTDSRGRFEVTDFASGRTMRRLCAIKDGLAWGVSEPFTVTKGQGRSDIVIRLGQGGSIVGSVVDEDGNPVPAAQLVLFEKKEDRKVEFSRADGRFEFEAVPAGVYALVVFPPGLVKENRSTYARLTREGIPVETGRKTEVRLVLKPGSQLSGRVIDLYGLPLEGVVVRCRPESKVGPFTPFRLLYYRVALTDAQGQFRIDGLLSDQTHYLHAAKPGYNRSFAKGVPPGSTDTVFALIKVRTLEGRVVSGHGDPIPEFWIRGSRNPDPVGRKVGRSESTVPVGLYADPAGRFRMWLIPGSYQIEAQAAGGFRSDPMTVEIPVRGQLPVVELVVRTGASVHGTVRTASGIAVARATVRVLDLKATPPKRVGYATTDSQGRFMLDSLSPGNFRIEAFDGMSAQQIARAIELRAGSDLEADLALHPGVPVAVTVNGPGSRPIEGARVTVRRADGVPLFANLSRFKHTKAAANARKAERRRLPNMADLQKSINRSLELTDAQGRLAVLYLIPGRYVIEATAPGHMPSKKTVTISSGGTRAIEVRLKKD